jgi:large subunit ribosomal protein L13
MDMSTESAKPATVRRAWYLVDAQGKTLGRLASELARRLRGKHKPQYTPHVDTGDYMVVINADKVRLTGKKGAEKEYQRYSGYPGGRTVELAADLRHRKPEAMVEIAVRGMLPKNRLGRRIFNNLHVVAGTAHKHEAQKPRVIDINSLK